MDIPFISQHLKKKPLGGRPENIPLGAKGKVQYPVYLIKPNDDTEHTRLIRFLDEKEVFYYFLESNKRVYARSEIKNVESSDTANKIDGNLQRDSCNVIFISTSGELEVGRLEFTPDAKKTILEMDNLKFENRTYERIIVGTKTKYGARPLETLLYVAMVGVITMLLMWASWDGVSKVMAQVNSGAHDAYITTHTPILVDLTNLTLGNQTTNQSGIGQRLDHT